MRMTQHSIQVQERVLVKWSATKRSSPECPQSRPRRIDNLPHQCMVWCTALQCRIQYIVHPIPFHKRSFWYLAAYSNPDSVVSLSWSHRCIHLDPQSPPSG